MTDDAHELARLLPDPAREGLPEHRHHTLRERFMQEINQPVRARRRPIALVAGVAAALVLVVAVSVAIGSVLNGRGPSPIGSPPEGVPTPTRTVTAGPIFSGQMPEQPPPFRVRYDQTEVILYPHTYCYTGGCVDGFDPDPLSVGSPEEIFVFVPVFHDLVVGMQDGEEGCGRAADAAVTAVGEGWWRVRPQGPAGAYTVSIFASDGPGDMVATLLWRSASDEPLPEPVARLALIAEHDGVPDSYGLELGVRNLATSPTTFSATITVTAANGESMTIEAAPLTDDCQGTGTVSFDGPDDQARQAAALGGLPFTYEVELVLDGATHVAVATYPDDVIEYFEPSVALTFTPPLE